MPRRRLLGQLFPSFVLPVSLAVVAVAWFAMHGFEALSLSSVRERLTAEARALADRVAASDEADAPVVESDRGIAGPTRFVALTTQGNVLFDSARRRSGSEGWLDRSEVRHALEGRSESALRTQSSPPQRVLSVAVPVERDGQVVGAVTAVESLAELDHAIEQFENRLVWAGIAAAGVAALCIFLVWRRWARPLEEMRRAAERFARGELGFRVMVPDSDELAGLAEALNQMSQQLQERISTIVRQNNEQKAVLSSMVEGVLAVDNQERVISLNKASGQLLGIDQTQAQGRSLQEVVRNADLRRFVSRALSCHEPIDDDVVLHGDHEGVLQARSAALHDAQGRGIGAVVVLNDVTDFRRLEHIRRDFVANVSHELKTPITSIKGFVETLLDGAISDPEDAQRFLQIVAKQADRLDAIIEDLLSLSKIEQGEESGDIELVTGRVKDVIDAAIHICQPKAEERQIRICAACEGDIVAKMNPALLEQALINLLDNALKYSEPGSEVQMLASQFFDEVTITVADRGCGITTEHLPRIFERFYRVDKGRSRKLGGTGLGLAIVKHIVQAHHGRVTVKSTPSLGSTFTIHLPRLAEHLNGQVTETAGK